ncbi:MAG TPA: hypothetical protein VHQ65_10375 [Thermoanaerobaculia bacterium]|nr:hypothetical protein [Thermoanaerobaculia bacterium]
MGYHIDRGRIEELLEGYEVIREERRFHPEEMARRNPEFRTEFDHLARQVIIPVLQEIADVLRRRVDAVSIFHRLTTAGVHVKLDPWEDFDRSLVFYGDDEEGVVRVTHDGVGFGLLCNRLAPGEVTSERVEEEAMRFLERVLHQEPEGRRALDDIQARTQERSDRPGGPAAQTATPGPTTSSSQAAPQAPGAAEDRTATPAVAGPRGATTGPT